MKTFWRTWKGAILATILSIMAVSFALGIFAGYKEVRAERDSTKTVGVEVPCPDFRVEANGEVLIVRDGEIAEESTMKVTDWLANGGLYVFRIKKADNIRFDFSDMFFTISDTAGATLLGTSRNGDDWSLMASVYARGTVDFHIDDLESRTDNPYIETELQMAAHNGLYVFWNGELLMNKSCHGSHAKLGPKHKLYN